MTQQNTISWIQSPAEFPDTRLALTQPNGLLAASETLDSDWLLASYQRGVFPWYNQGEPVLWWSPSPRAVLFTNEFKLSRSLRKTLRKVQSDPTRQITLNHDFEDVIRACAEPRRDEAGTWITEEIIQAYCHLHQRGHAHSVEHWHNNELVGGLYCVSLGRMVYGESMFSRQTDASKTAFACFVAWLIEQNVHIIDCQQATRHLLSMGAREIERQQFETALVQAAKQPPLTWAPRQLEWKHD